MARTSINPTSERLARPLAGRAPFYPLCSRRVKRTGQGGTARNGSTNDRPDGLAAVLFLAASVQLGGATAAHRPIIGPRGVIDANILYMPACSVPAGSGDKITTFNKIRHLSTKHEVHVVCLADGRRDLDNIPDLRRYAQSVTAVPVVGRTGKLRALKGDVRWGTTFGGAVQRSGTT
jgi:hypothetical protein